jgi:hypothetical protein
MNREFATTVTFVASLASLTGCATLSPPFDKMKDSAMTVYRLQNYEQPAAQPAAASPAVAGVPNFVPPQLQTWASEATKLLPPGLLPPGLIPGLGGATGATPGAPTTDANCAAAPQTVTAQCFHGFRILGFQPVADAKLRGEIATLFGKETNFTERRDNCLYAEFGFSMAQADNPAAPADVLVSLSCQHVQAYNFAWPYVKDGIKEETQKQIATVVQRVFTPAN